MIRIDENELKIVHILIDVEENFIQKAEYVFKTYCSVLGLIPRFYHGSTRKKVDIYYGSMLNTHYPLTIKYNQGTSDFFLARGYYPRFSVRFNNYKNEKIPFFFSDPGRIYALGDKNVRINKDIIASGFYLLSCWKEYIDKTITDSKKNSDPTNNEAEDNFNPDDRFDYKKSMQYNWDFSEVPVVDAYCDILSNMLEFSFPNFLKGNRWANDKKFCVTLSHDIDYWDVWNKEHLKDIYAYNKNNFKKRPIRASYKIVGHYFTKSRYNPVKAIKKILKKESRLEVKSTNFILVQDVSDDKRRTYFSDDKYKSQLKKVFDPKNVGLHGSPKSAYTIKFTKKELEKIQKLFPDRLGYRSHKLSFQYQISFNILEKMNMKYDSSLGYWEHIGFRAGISYPFYPYDIENDRPFNILEIPLIVMDTTLISHLGMKLNPLTASYRLSKLMQRAQKFQSHISLLWHNNTFDDVDYPGWGWLYWSLIKRTKKNGGWVCSMDELYDFWISKINPELSPGTGDEQIEENENIENK